MQCIHKSFPTMRRFIVVFQNRWLVVYVGNPLLSLYFMTYLIYCALCGNKVYILGS